MERSASSHLYKFSEKEAKDFFKRSKKRFRIEGLDILLAPRSFDYGRILVITPKKSGNSPQRNLIRRRIKHIFYEEKLFQNPFDCVVIVSKNAIDLRFDRLKEILTNLYSKVDHDHKAT